MHWTEFHPIYTHVCKDLQYFLWHAMIGTMYLLVNTAL